MTQNRKDPFALGGKSNSLRGNRNFLLGVENAGRPEMGNHMRT